MKTKLRTAIVFSALAVGLGLTSCVAPYDAYGSTTVTTYNPGYRINSLPSGYRTEIISGNRYYYHNGHYYRSRSGGYVVVDAPRSSRYYSEYDRHHNHGNDRRDRDGRRGGGDRYNQQTRIITRLPDGSRPVTYRGQSYYQHRDQYYRRQGNGYIVVSKPF